MTDAPVHAHEPGEHGHDHGHGHRHDHGRSHDHPRGIRRVLREIFVPHTHDPADSVDDVLEASVQGVRALKVSLLVLLATTLLQFVIVFISNSVALLADTVHNFSDALTAVPLWIAFILARRAPSRRYPYGYGRAEDLAGLFIVLVVGASAIVAAWQSIDRLLNPQPLENLGWLLAAGVVGFLGNEAVAVYRIRVGRRIGSAALVADGVHARTDGFTSLAVVVGAIGAMLGFPLADPLIGLVIAAAIFVLLWGTIVSVGRRLMDGIEPELLDRAEHALADGSGVAGVETVRLRWIGHRMSGEAIVLTHHDAASHEFETIADDAEARLRRALPRLDAVTVQVRRATGAPTA